MPSTSLSSRLQSRAAQCRNTLIAAFACTLLLALPGAAPCSAAAPAAASPTNPAAPVVLTPAQANAALRVLDDPVQRAHVTDTLRAIAAAGALATPASAPTAAPAGASGASASAASSAAASTPLANALRSNGLVLQVADGAARGVQAVGQRLLSARAALFNVASARDWWSTRLGTPQGHAMLLSLLRVLLLTLVPAFAIEAILRRVISKPRRAIVEHAALAQDADEARGTNGGPAAASNAADAPGTSDSSPSAPEAASVQPTETDQAALRAAAGMTPAAAPPGTDTTTDASLDERASARASALAAEADNASGQRIASLARETRHRIRSAQHWRLLKRLPWALLVAVLELVPVIAFGLCAAGVLSLMDPADAALAAAVGQIVDTWVVCRAIIVIGNMLFAPDADALRLMPLSGTWAAFAQRWLERIVVIGGVGGALGGVVPLGMTEDTHLALLKLVILFAHVALAVAILQCRQPVAAAIRKSAAERSSFAYLVHWFADIWAAAAVFVVMALWFVWALDLRGGYRELMRAGGISLAVLLAARMVAIVSLGALGRMFDPNGNSENMTIAQRRAYRYYPALRRVVIAVLWIATLDILLRVWGLHPGRLIANAPIGHLIGSALLTIAIAIAVAIVIWEAANGAAERRLNAWTDAGDFVRAARLRTLLPMFRTTLFVAILVVVGLTALSQLGVNTAPLIAGASIFGVALGFGSQKLVQDFITGIFLLTENAMQVGDWVTVAGVSGTVEFLSIRTVRLRGGDGSLYTVPFSSVTTVNNTNRGIGNAAVKVLIAHGADLQRAIDTLKEIGAEIRNDEAYKNGILSDFAYWGVDQVDGSSVTLVGQMQCKDSARWGVQREFNRRVLARFTERGIELANPQRSFLIGRASGSDVEGRMYGDGQRAASDDDNDGDRAARRSRGEGRGKPN
ncbi:moderate conductance mechanosensitive channel [Paraburkholderia sacchari]|uniref:mechanosensitive ion channel family protein n=1 Tax=Paraburkholderia sacchari TaxID=159450 RepID=UPI0039A64C5F